MWKNAPSFIFIHSISFTVLKGSDQWKCFVQHAQIFQAPSKAPQTIQAVLRCWPAVLLLSFYFPKPLPVLAFLCNKLGYRRLLWPPIPTPLPIAALLPGPNRGYFHSRKWFCYKLDMDLCYCYLNHEHKGPEMLMLQVKLWAFEQQKDCSKRSYDK